MSEKQVNQAKQRAKKAVELHLKGKSRKEIAEIVGVSQKAVLGYLSAAGIGLRNAQYRERAIMMRSEGFSIRKIADELGVSIRTVQKYLATSQTEQRKCSRCKKFATLERFKGQRLCPECLLFGYDDTEVSLEYAVEWESARKSGVMLEE